MADLKRQLLDLKDELAALMARVQRLEQQPKPLTSERAGTTHQDSTQSP